MKKKLMIIMLAIITLVSFGFANNKTAFAEDNADYIYYVALGDSIASGYKLPEYGQQYFVTDSYTYNFKLMLEDKLGVNNVNSTTFAYNGDTTTDLLAKLEDSYIVATLKTADIVTVTIGANDVLNSVLANVSNYIINTGMSIADMENLLSANLNLLKESGNLNKILARLYNINPKATYIFTNCYNPYKHFSLPTNNFLLNAGLSAAGFSKDKINKISEIAEDYIAGGTNSQNQTIQGLNQLLQLAINSFNKDNFILSDIKSAFEVYNLSTTPTYDKLVNSNITKNSTIGINDLTNTQALMERTDPHPTAVGHKIISDALSEYVDDKCLLELRYNGLEINGKLNELFLYNKNEVVDISNITFDEDYIFNGWYTTENFEEDTEWTGGTITENLTLYANLKKEVQVIFNSNGGTEIPAIDCLACCTVAAPEDPIRDGYKFMGWYTDENFAVESLWSFDNVVKDNLTLYAKWLKEIAVTFNTNGAGEIESINTYEGEKIAEPAPLVKQNHRFEGWYTTPSFEVEGLWDFNNILGVEDITLYAKWIKQTTIQFVTNCEATINSITIDAGEKIEEPESIIKNGYKFDGWYTTPNYAAESLWNFDNVINDNLTLYAKWLKEVTVTFNTNGVGEIDSINTYEGEKIAEPEPLVKQDYKFDGWYTTPNFAAESLWNFDNKLGEYNITLYAKWVKQVTVTFSTNCDSKVDNIILDIGNKVQQPEELIKTGYKFRGWYTTEIFTDGTEWNFDNVVTKDLTLYAKWSKIHTVTFNSNGANQIPSINILDGERISSKPPIPVKMDADENIFAGWQYNSKIWNFNADVVTSDITLVANWVGLECNNTQNLNQLINNPVAVGFSVAVSDATFAWYVNETLQQGQQSNTFSFTPHQSVASYKVFCVVNGVQTKDFTIVVDYVVPANIELNKPQKDGNEYTFSLKDGEYYNPNKIIWYKTIDIYTDAAQQIGMGVSCIAEITLDCYVFAVYGDTVISERFEVIADRDMGGLLIIVCCLCGVVLAGVIVWMIISKIKSSRDY